MKPVKKKIAEKESGDRMEGGRRIKAVRDGYGMTQAQFAKELEVTQPMVSSWESGRDTPSAEIWIRLGVISGYPECFWFWQQAGLDRKRLISSTQNAFNDLIEDGTETPLMGKLIIIPPYQKEASETKEAAPRVVEAKDIPNPLSTSYCVVDEQSEGYGFEIGDVLYLDESDTGTPSVAHFWEQPILVEYVDSADSSSREQIVGRLFLRESRHQGPEGLPSIAFYEGMFQPWTNVHHEVGEMRGRNARYYLRGDRLKDSGPFAITYGDQEVVKDSRKDLESEFARVRERVRMSIRLIPEFRILGRVIGWFRPPSKSGK